MFDNIRDELKEHVMLVEFTKKDGTTRTMKATLKEEYLPDVVGNSARKVNPDVVPVFDLDNNGWRSFRLDSIINAEVVE